MLFDDFARTSHDFWTRYFGFVAQAQREGRIEGGEILFPTMQIATQFDGIYVAELIGAVRIFDRLRLKKNRGSSIYAYLDQFGVVDEPNAVFNIDTSGIQFENLGFSHEADFKALQERFPFIDLSQSKLIGTNARGSLFKFGPNFRSCHIENCVLINRMENIYRCKHMLSAMVIASKVPKKKLLEFYSKIINQTGPGGRQSIHSVHAVDGKRTASVLVAPSLQNLYLSVGMRETTIADILRDHSEILRGALKSKHIEFAPYLRWIEHDGTVDEQAIIPDFMAQREDGFFDIYDLKTAALDRRRITKGQRRRRRFIDYVEEGMAQLANYREYFSYTANAQFAADRYGIRVKSPKLTLIAGSMDNTDAGEVVEACRRYRDIALIDYDTLVQLFIGGAMAEVEILDGSSGRGGG